MKTNSRNNTHTDILKIGSKNLNTENWKVYHPNGRHMFTCGEKKANWYLERNLASLIGINKIKFTFDPKGMGFDDDEEFGRNVRQMRCVVSGVEFDLQRHHIIPYCYRTYFPNEFKSKNHHDVVLINKIRHSEYEQQATLFKDEIANKFNVKTISEFNANYAIKLRQVGKENFIILNAISSLFKGYGKLDNEIKLAKLHFISERTNIPFTVLSKYNYIQLYKIYTYLKYENDNKINKFKKENRILFDHGYQVVKQLDTDKKIIKFVKLWRNHFIDTMQPQYMPDGWSVDFRTKTKIS